MKRIPNFEGAINLFLKQPSPQQEKNIIKEYDPITFSKQNCRDDIAERILCKNVKMYVCMM